LGVDITRVDEEGNADAQGLLQKRHSHHHHPHRFSAITQLPFTLPTGLDEQAYLEGRYDPATYTSLFTTFTDGNTGIPSQPGGRPHYLLKVVHDALLRMYTDFHTANPNVLFWVQSSLRNFDTQKGIWDGKYTSRPCKNEATPGAKADCILRYSAMPGTSRHHWGTDFDLNVLENSYYASGNGLKLYNWLTANAATYGFAQPYIAGRTAGYLEEKWHWSYVAYSSVLMNRWLAVPNRVIQGFQGGFAVSHERAAMYVATVNPACSSTPASAPCAFFDTTDTAVPTGAPSGSTVSGNFHVGACLASTATACASGTTAQAAPNTHCVGSGPPTCCV